MLVYEPTLVSLNHVAHTLALLGEGRDAILVENHTRARKSTLVPKQISHALAGREPDITIPFEPKLPGATNRGTPDGSLGRSYRKALDRLVESLTRPTVSAGCRLRRGPGTGLGGCIGRQRRCGHGRV